MSKIFVDSKFRTPESRSGSDFTIELLEPLMLPPECKVRVTNLTCPVSWWTIDTPNQHLYFSEKNPDNSIRYHVAVLPRGMCNGPQLASTIASVMNPLSVYGPSTYAVNYSDSKGVITVTMAAPGEQVTFWDDQSLRSLDPWPFAIQSAQQPASFGKNLRLTRKTVASFNAPYTSEFVDLLGTKSLYLTTTSLGNLGSVGPRRGQRSTLCCVPVTIGFGYTNVQEATSGIEQETKCGGQLVKRLDFKLEDSEGMVLDLHGLDISFTLTFVAE